MNQAFNAYCSISLEYLRQEQCIQSTELVKTPPTRKLYWSASVQIVVKPASIKMDKCIPTQGPCSKAHLKQWKGPYWLYWIGPKAEVSSELDSQSLAD